MSKKAAPRILEAIRRMQLEAPPADNLQRSSSVRTDASSVAITPSHTDQSAGELRLPARDERPSLTSVYSTDVMGRPITMTAQAGPDTGLGVDGTADGPAEVQSPQAAHSRAFSAGDGPSAIAEEEMPSEPALNPWQLQRKALSTSPLSDDAAEGQLQRRDMLPAAASERSISLGSVPQSQDTAPSRAGRLDFGVDRMIQEVEEAAQRMVVDQYDTPSAGLLAPSMNYDATTRAAHDGKRSVSESPVLPAHRWSQASSAGSYQQSISSVRGPRDSMVSPVTTDNRTSMFSNVGDISPLVGREGGTAGATDTHKPAVFAANFAPWQLSNGSDAPESTNAQFDGGGTQPSYMNPWPRMNTGAHFQRDTTPILYEQPGLELVQERPEPQIPYQIVDHGLIPVNPDTALETIPERPRRQVDYSISLTSSFHQMKGFCEGAKEVIRGGLGVKRVEHPLVSLCHVRRVNKPKHFY